MAGRRAAIADPNALSTERTVTTPARIEVVFVEALVAFTARRAVPAVEFDVGRAFAVAVQHAIDELKEIGQAPFGEGRRHRRFPLAETNSFVVDVRMRRVDGTLRGMGLDGDDAIRVRLVEP